MGMRAAVVYRMKSGNVRMSTLQWSTILDKTFVRDIESAVNNHSAKSKVEATRNFMRNATTINGHYSSIESMTGAEVAVERRKKGLGSPKSIRKIGPLSYGVFHGDNYPATNYGNISDAQIRSVCNECLDGGSVGIYYDERNPTVVQFFRLNDDYDLVFENYSLV